MKSDQFIFKECLGVIAILVDFKRFWHKLSKRWGETDLKTSKGLCSLFFMWCGSVII